MKPLYSTDAPATDADDEFPWTEEEAVQAIGFDPAEFSEDAEEQP